MSEPSELAAEADGSEAWKPTMKVDEVKPSTASKNQDEDPRHIEQNPESSERAISIDIDIDLSESAQTSKRLSADDSNGPTTFGEPDNLLSPVVPAVAPDAPMAVSEDGQQQPASKTIHEDRLAAVDGVEVLEPTLLAAQTHRSSVASQGSRTSSMDACEEEKPTVVHGVCLIAFHHTFGPIVEYSYPPELKDDEDIVKNLPFLALPDGAHMVGGFGLLLKGLLYYQSRQSLPRQLDRYQTAGLDKNDRPSLQTVVSSMLWTWISPPILYAFRRNQLPFAAISSLNLDT